MTDDIKHTAPAPAPTGNVIQGPGLIRPGAPAHDEDLEEYRPSRANRATFLAMRVGWPTIRQLKEVELAQALIAIADAMPAFEGRPTSVAVQMIPNPDPNDVGIALQIQCQCYSAYREDIVGRHLHEAVKKELGR